jgi:hypothetical protein
MYRGREASCSIDHSSRPRPGRIIRGTAEPADAYAFLAGATREDITTVRATTSDGQTLEEDVGDDAESPVFLMISSAGVQIESIAFVSPTDEEVCRVRWIKRQPILDC